ncbi:SDR family oxidoreductase [Acuticoccus sp. I52.16.1]|uniref:SDR family oxidoreductase n=1 Tax=Acuticoccus sp. I52.16.1 TaxID=2928472 RepID=UPI001FD2A6E5|nr:SDR family oxidoreductase [Acuticoccus sp. I52.16.1]UOM36566.1 SDR family oxidoreductase [Acuticoccus sp. I52.16.1]
MDVNGKVCVVSGGASGLGRGAVQALAERGAHVAVLDLAGPGALPAGGEGNIAHYACDITDDAAVARAVDDAVARWGRIDVCVNCAGIVASGSLLGPQAQDRFEAFRRTVEVNLTGTFIVMARTAERMAQNAPGPDGERGVIVNTSSIAALDASSSAAYAASKGGVASLSLTVARELGAHGIRVNAIAPGFMDTAMFNALPDDWTASLVARTVFPNRLGDPAEFGALVLHLVENRFFNAALIRFDAGARV